MTVMAMVLPSLHREGLVFGHLDRLFPDAGQDQDDEAAEDPFPVGD